MTSETHILRADKSDDFFSAHGAALARQGAVVASWRWRGGQRIGPYFRLDVRTAGGKTSALYLGAEGPLVAAVRERLAELQRPLQQSRQRAKTRRSLSRALRTTWKNLAEELAKVGLRLWGSEIRGFAQVKRAQSQAASLATDNPADLPEFDK